MAIHPTGIRIKNCLKKADTLIPDNAWGKNLEETYLPEKDQEEYLEMWTTRAEMAIRDLSELLSLSDRSGRDKKEARKLISFLSQHLSQYGKGRYSNLQK